MMVPASASTPSAVAAASIQAWVRISMRRRSTTSASAPAGSASTKKGKVVAVCMSETMSGDGASVAIVHAAAVSCIHVPTFDTTAAIQSQRKARRRNGRGSNRCRFLLGFGKGPPQHGACDCDDQEQGAGDEENGFKCGHGTLRDGGDGNRLQTRIRVCERGGAGELASRETRSERLIGCDGRVYRTVRNSRSDCSTAHVAQ